MRSPGKALTLAATLLLLAFPFLVWWKAQALVDWWALKDYVPPARVAELATSSSMTPEARRIFYVNHPELIADIKAFREQCPQSEQTIVLGCYHSNQRGIDIYDVKDPRLSGIHEVTAAHEMLHAAYDRLDGEEKRQLNAELRKFYDNGLKDQRIMESIGSYKDLSEDELVNEMHSIFGTEAGDLPPVLAEHYKKFFINRSEVTSLAQNYENEFTSRKSAIEEYDKQLSSLKQDIEETSRSLERQREQIVQERQRLDSLRTSGRVEEYNASVAAFNNQVDLYNLALSRLRREISTYNNLVEERNALARELKVLEGSIDTRMVPEPVK